MAEIENKYGSIVTDVGVQLITEAVMEGQKVNITTLAVGDGGGSYYKPNSTMTALKGEKWRGKVNRVEVNEKSPNMIDVVAVVPSDVGGWTIREMGVFDDAEEPNMIAVCNTPDTEKVIITSGAAGEIELTMHIEISNTGAISFVIDPNVVTATKKDLADHNTSQTAHAAEFEKKADVTALNDHANNSDIHVNPTTMGNYDTAIAGLIDHRSSRSAGRAGHVGRRRGGRRAGGGGRGGSPVRDCRAGKPRFPRGRWTVQQHHRKPVSCAI